MDRDLGRLDIDKLIVHDVPSRRVNTQGPSPTLSEIESPLTSTARNYIRDKVVGTLANNSFPVVFDTSSGSPVPSLVMDNLGNQTTPFVDASQSLALHLFQTQKGYNPPGLLAVAQTKIEGIRSLALMKLEREAGARVAATQFQGKSTFDVEHLRDLMLTDKTRVFKVGFFVQEGSTLGSIHGLVSDNQSAQWHKSDVADFFLRGFLGCELREEPRVTTRNYLDATEEWINSSVTDPVSKTRYEVATLAEMQRNVSSINPRTFAHQHLELPDRQSYINHLQERQVPVTEFPKDNSMIEPRLRRISMELESGVVILGKTDVFEEKVHITEIDTGESRIEIIDRVKGMRGRR